MRSSLLAGLSLLAPMASAQSPVGAPDRYVLDHARIYTVDRARPLAEAMAVDAGRVVALGTSAEMAAAYADWPRVEMEGRTVVPGLIDAHAHLMGLGESLLQADLVGTGSVAEIGERLRAFAATAEPGAWVTGRGWDQNDWGAGGAFPTREMLDTFVPDRPVWVQRIDGHASWANTAALRAAGIDPDAPAPADPAGGQVVRDAAGRPTGVFVDAAELLVARSVPPPSAAATAEALRRAVAETAAAGLTGVHDAGVPPATLGLYATAIEAGRFPIRVYAMLQPETYEAFCAATPVPSVHPSGRLVV
ncbi:MAG TPA: amidohydrolase family protein, partial [Rubricoccaceae bacterium]